MIEGDGSLDPLLIDSLGQDAIQCPGFRQTMMTSNTACFHWRFRGKFRQIVAIDSSHHLQHQPCGLLGFFVVSREVHLKLLRVPLLHVAVLAPNAERERESAHRGLQFLPGDFFGQYF
jgi:hypothetical protein